jgi:two-component system, OmpR family, sensor histidine kinase KdpD
MARGQLRIYLGAAPGVGKTYAMLAEGQRRHGRGTDVAIGLLETHGRRLTAEMAGGLERVPRRVLVYRGAEFTEMDLDAVLARHPQVALVDELAHTNVPGCRNGKRWQDVDELLDAGIDVVTTLNIQHLESLNDVVAQITGTQQRETLPDEVARRAEQIELVDMTAQALRRRMVHGNVYPPDRIEAALTHYFRPGNLTALRELALLWLADRVDEGLQRYRAEHGIAAPWETRERILVGIAGVRGEEAVIRRAARIAAGTPGSDLLAVHVRGDDATLDRHQDMLAAQRDLAVSLGASYRQLSGDDVPRTLLQFAQAENVTQMVIGASRHGRLVTLFTGEDIGSRVTRRSGPIDVHQVGRETGRRQYLPYLARSLAGAHPHGARYLLITLAALAAALLAVASYLLPASRPAGLASLLGGLAVALIVLAAAAAGVAAEHAGTQAMRAARVNAEATVLARLGGRLLSGHGETPALLEEIRQQFGLAAVSLLERQRHNGVPGPRWYVLASTGERPPETPDADMSVPVSDVLTLVGRGRALSADEQRVLSACAVQLGTAFAGQGADRRAAGPEKHAADRRSRAAVLAATGRDAREQITAADSALASLADPAAAHTPAERAALIKSARRAVRRLGQLVTDLRDLSRLHAGAVETYLRPVDLDDVLATCLEELGPGGHHIALRVADDVPDVIADADLLSRVLTSLIADALHRSPPDQAPAVTAATRTGHVEIRIADRGLAGRPNGGGDSLAVRLALDVTEAISGTLRCEQVAGRGRTVIITLPAAARRGARAPAAHGAT